MAHIQPFKALRPDPTYASKVASRPYDVMSRAEAKDEVRGNPYSFLHITRSEIDLPDTVGLYDDQVYETAKDNLKAFISRNLLFKEIKACYYIYRLTMNGRQQTGLVCVSSVDDYNKNVIKKHEFTRPEKENDRIKHITTTGAQTGNVFLAYRQVAEIDALISQWQNNRSANYEFATEDEVNHEIWVVNSDKTIETITQLFAAQVPATYIADGHHRAASASKSHGQFKTEKANNKSAWFLTTLFPANQLHIMDYNRVVTDLNGHSPEAFLKLLGKNFEITPKGLKPFGPKAPQEFGMYLQGHWYKLSAKAGSFTTDPIGILDVSVLSTNILDPLLGIKDQRTDKRIDFVGGIRGLDALQSRVDSGEMAVAFSLYPVSMDQLFTVADSGEVMPPKSTWFEPKLRDGLLTHVVA